MNCAQVKIQGIPFRSQRTLSAHTLPTGGWWTQQQHGCQWPGSIIFTDRHELCYSWGRQWSIVDTR